MVKLTVIEGGGKAVGPEGGAGPSGPRAKLIARLVAEGFDRDTAIQVAHDMIAEWRHAEETAELWLQGVPVPEPDPDMLRAARARLKAKESKQAQPPAPATRRRSSVDKLIAESLAIEAESAQEAGALGYMARALVQATMPHSRSMATTFMRENGAFAMALMAHPKAGLPYGSIPRLLVAYLTTEAVRTKSRDIVLGATLSEFMSHLKEVPTGGRWGSITRVRDQTTRLFSSSISCTYTADADGVSGMNLAVADSFKLWWDPQQPHQLTLFDSYVRLGERFFDEVTNNPVPIDLRALRALKKSPMALDIYAWLTYRMSYLRRPTVIPWEALQLQFGAEYSRSRDFKAAFLKHLRAVLALYPEARVEEHAHGLELRPSVPHIPKL
jgi:hypothetical protein